MTKFSVVVVLCRTQMNGANQPLLNAAFIFFHLQTFFHVVQILFNSISLSLSLFFIFLNASLENQHFHYGELN